jgi:predicted DNA-binding transcriptional regulator YafY
MASKRVAGRPKPTPAVTAARAARLYQLLTLLRAAPQSRDALTRRLGLDTRGFYRDLELVRTLGVPVGVEGHRYVLGGSFEGALANLPFPDPKLNLHEAIRLAEGEAAARRRFRQLIDRITGSTSTRRPARARGK